MFSKTWVMGRRASSGPRSITVQDEVSVNKASANSSGVATFGPIDCWNGRGRCQQGLGLLLVTSREHVMIHAFKRAPWRSYQRALMVGIVIGHRSVSRT